MNKFLNLTLRTLALTSAIGEFSEARKRILSASKALLESFTLFDKVMALPLRSMLSGAISSAFVP